MSNYTKRVISLPLVKEPLFHTMTSYGLGFLTRKWKSVLCQFHKGTNIVFPGVRPFVFTSGVTSYPLLHMHHISSPPHLYCWRNLDSNLKHFLRKITDSYDRDLLKEVYYSFFLMRRN